MLYIQFNLEGWRSGQSQQTVNLPSLALRWFKSSSLHHIFLFIFLFTLSGSLYSQEKDLYQIQPSNDFISQKIDAYIEHEKLTYKIINKMRLIQASTYLSLFAINKHAEFSDLTVSGIYLYRFFYIPEFKSDLLSINSKNASQTIPELEIKIKKKRKRSSIFRLINGIGLALYVSTNDLSSQKTISLTSVASQLIAGGIINLSSKSANEIFLNDLYMDFQNYKTNSLITQ